MRPAIQTTRPGRIVITAGLAGTLVIMLIVFRTVEHSDPAVSIISPVAENALALQAELKRCDSLGPNDPVDPACRAAWAENRNWFFGGTAHPIAPPVKPVTTMPFASGPYSASAPAEPAGGAP